VEGEEQAATAPEDRCRPAPSPRRGRRRSRATAQIDGRRPSAPPAAPCRPGEDGAELRRRRVDPAMDPADPPLIGQWRGRRGSSPPIRRHPSSASLLHRAPPPPRLAPNHRRAACAPPSPPPPPTATALAPPPWLAVLWLLRLAPLDSEVRTARRPSRRHRCKQEREGGPRGERWGGMAPPVTAG
jgi:hypothetical protein